MDVIDWRNALSGHGEDGYFDLGVFQLRRRAAGEQTWFEIKFLPYPSFQKVNESKVDLEERTKILGERYVRMTLAKCVSIGIAIGMLERVKPFQHTPDPIVVRIEQVLRDAKRKLSKAELLSLTRFSEAQWAQFLSRRPDTISLESHGRGARYWYSGGTVEEEKAPAQQVPTRRFADYVGQQAIRERLSKYIAGSLQRGDTLDHVLLAGPPGLGKSTLAEIIAGELGRPMHTVWATRVANLPEFLDSIPNGDVVFIDEIHRLSAQQQEQIFEHMKRPITIIAATNFPGELVPALRDRFSIKETIRLYTPDELAQIITDADPTVPANVAAEIARRARGTPRIALALTRRLRDLDGLRPDTFKTAFDVLEIDERGLEKRDREYLDLLDKAGGPVGVDTLALSLQESAENVEQVIEPFLLQQGLISRTKAGRQITDAGKAVLAGIGTTGRRRPRPKNSDSSQQETLL